MQNERKESGDLDLRDRDGVGPPNQQLCLTLPSQRAREQIRSYILGRSLDIGDFLLQSQVMDLVARMKDE